MTAPSGDDLTTALGLARYAEEYLAAAFAADDYFMGLDGYKLDDFPPMPVLFLLAHAIELSLKAYCRKNGDTVAQITSLKHDLCRAHARAVELNRDGLTELDEDHLATLRLVSQLHCSTRLRYIRTGGIELPTGGAIRRLAIVSHGVV